MRIKAALETLLKLHDEGLLARFAIGGAIAASYYVEAMGDEGLDVFAFLTPAPSGRLLLGPLYERLRDPMLLEVPAEADDDPRHLVIGLIDGKHWSAVITNRESNVRLRSVRRARPEEVALHES